MRYSVHLIDQEWWVQASDTGWQVGGFPSEQCATEVADSFTRIEEMLMRVERMTEAERFEALEEVRTSAGGFGCDVDGPDE